MGRVCAGGGAQWRRGGRGGEAFPQAGRSPARSSARSPRLSALGTTCAALSCAAQLRHLTLRDTNGLRAYPPNEPWPFETLRIEDCSLPDLARLPVDRLERGITLSGYLWGVDGPDSAPGDNVPYLDRWVARVCVLSFTSGGAISGKQMIISQTALVWWVSGAPPDARTTHRGRQWWR